MIYADHAATTAISTVAINAMKPYIDNEYGNPSTLYSLARNPRRAVSAARKSIAEAIGAKEHEIYFTSGGTEADNSCIGWILWVLQLQQGQLVIPRKLFYHM